MFKRNKCKCISMMHGRQYFTIECKRCIKWHKRVVVRSIIVMDW